MKKVMLALAASALLLGCSAGPVGSPSSLDVPTTTTSKTTTSTVSTTCDESVNVPDDATVSATASDCEK